jgi:hypothetical protein
MAIFSLELQPQIKNVHMKPILSQGSEGAWSVTVTVTVTVTVIGYLF